MPDVRVILADDHPVVRSGLVALLAAKDGIDVVAEAGDGQECLAAVARLSPDVVLMDLRMPRLDGAAATAAITSAHPATKVVVLTTYDEDADIVRAVEAGAVGYLLKDSGADQIVRAVRAAARGETVLAPRMATTLMNHLRAPSGPALSPREIEVLGGVGEGLSNAEIGRRLHITEATVKTHLVRAFAKLGTQDRTRAVLEAMRAGYLPGP
ncbi:MULTISPECIES: response regulator transcription factor [Brevibacterium]|jgi:DNA-binding NarL/FixJ family response regulator|uniref:Response regulator transcription factor n=1 Tax=Brevibacterium casei TaxID=33889 RepID=A0A7T4A0T2_9MICO|nr:MULTISPECIES: response regulator transcription factor [Brevibacterium]QQB15163.1 response regulator transcription factor [Brevibacterium casei]